MIDRMNERTNNIFSIRREERLLALLLIVLLVSINAMVIAHYCNVFTPIQSNYWNIFIGKFHISGFDSITLSVVSDWSAGYNVYRHPLLAFFMYPAYLLNQLLIGITGINCAIFIVAALQIFSAFYAAMFVYKICRDIVGIDVLSSYLLVGLYQSFAYIMLSGMVPDHFIFSSFFLTLSLYVTGRRLQSGRPMKIWQTVVYFLFTAGTSLNNGLKIFLSALFVNKGGFFRWRYLLLAVILPSALIWGFARWEYHVFVFPSWYAKKVAKEKKEAEKKKAADFAQAQRDSMLRSQGKTPETAKPVAKKQKRKLQGTPISNGEFSRWTDITTPRWASLVENVFGEGIQLHKDHLLQDLYGKRPMIVEYGMTLNYIVEGIIVVLFILGILCGLGSPLLWTCLSYFMLDMVLHVGFGFGLNEPYIMSAHWMYIIPIAIAYLLRIINYRFVWVLHLLLISVMMFLYGWNIGLMHTYLS